MPAIAASRIAKGVSPRIEFCHPTAERLQSPPHYNALSKAEWDATGRHRSIGDVS
jgi:hypothetical protein